MNIFKKFFGNSHNDIQEETKMTNTQKALELINTFATGDTKKATDLLAEGYIQHNLAYGTGRDAFVGSVAYLASASVKTTVNNIRAFEDGDKVFLQTVYNFAGAGEQVAFDIFRFDENGKIAEHWDNLAAKAEPNPSGRTQIDGTLEIKDLDKTNANREVVKNFLYDVILCYIISKRFTLGYCNISSLNIVEEYICILLFFLRKCSESLVKFCFSLFNCFCRSSFKI